MTNTDAESYVRTAPGPGAEEGPSVSLAESIVVRLRPSTAFDAGCGRGSLVEGLRALGVDAQGVDSSEQAIGQVPPELRSFCRLGDLTQELDGDYNLITCLEVLQHLTGADAQAAVANLCRHSDVILFSSSPDSFEEPHNLNVQSSDYWIGLFAAEGFFRNLDHDASYATSHAVLLERRAWTITDVAQAYERGWWQQNRTAEGIRAALDRAMDVVNVTTPALQAETERLAEELISASDLLDAASAERDRLASLLVIERAIFESQLAPATHAEQELAALRQTKVLRYTSVLRRPYGLMRSTWQRLLGRR